MTAPRTLTCDEVRDLAPLFVLDALEPGPRQTATVLPAPGDLGATPAVVSAAATGSARRGVQTCLKRRCRIGSSTR